MNQENSRVEQSPITQPGAVERIPQSEPGRTPEATPETGVVAGAERMEQVSEAAAIAAQSAGLPTVLPAPQATVVDSSAPASNIAADSPATAADDDLIEKEWVVRAKKIVDDTRDDPYAQERAVYELQHDYREKRGLGHTGA